MDIIASLNALADLGATWVMWVLVALSVLGLAVVAERAILYVTSRDDIARLRLARSLGP